MKLSLQQKHLIVNRRSFQNFKVKVSVYFFLLIIVCHTIHRLFLGKMETDQRLKLAQQSINSKNKKLINLVDNKTVFEEKINKFKESLKPNQDLKPSEDESNSPGNDISVCVRIRPMLDYENQADYFQTVLNNHPKVQVAEPKFTVRGESKIIPSTYNVDFSFGPENSTQDIYECVAEPVIQMGLQGGVSTIFAYGQTASGKTFTISGILDALIHDLMTQKEEHIELYISVFEILGNECKDLIGLNEQKVEIMEDKLNKVNVTNVQMTKIESIDACKDMIKDALKNRQSATTFKNDSSSRSHAIFSFKVKNLKHKSIDDGQIFVIDLAGSENAADSQFHDKTRIKETQAINKSLMALKDCIRNRALSVMNMDKYYHVPYRLSKLTLLLKVIYIKTLSLFLFV